MFTTFTPFNKVVLFREKMAQAYDFALDKMGMDFSSFTLWSDYIMFLKAVDAAGSYAENQKISAIRKIYHRGIVIPMLNVESLWYALKNLLFDKVVSFDKLFTYLLYLIFKFISKIGKTTFRSKTRCGQFP